MDTDIVTLLRSEDETQSWCGPEGLFQRGATEIERLRAVLEEVRELIDGYVDVKDGVSGQLPNDAMRAYAMINEALLAR